MSWKEPVVQALLLKTAVDYLHSDAPLVCLLVVRNISL